MTVMQMLSIKVPATAANIGPGYDCLGIALDKYLELTIEKDTHEKDFLWLNGVTPVPKEKNLILSTVEYILNKHNNVLNYTIRVTKNDIPIARGMGSSAAAIVAGVYCANYLLNDHYTEEELLTIACDLEGHPDNVAPAILGNLVMSKKIQHEYVTSIIQFPEALEFIVLTPDFEVSTEKARAILPKEYAQADVIENISNISFLINSLNQQTNYDQLRYFLNDRIHQPYRIQLIHNGVDIFNKSKALNTYGEFISGSGPTLILIIDKNDNNTLNQMIEFTNTLADTWTVENIEINRTGIITEVKA
jgi:homoserine kinase